MAYRPNVVWFSMEDTSPRFGCYGDPLAKTPNLDRLAARGRLWRQAFSTAPVCAPSRFSIITGVYAHAAGAHHMRTGTKGLASPGLPTPYEVVPPHPVRPFPELLRAAGYYCTNNAKTDYQFAPPQTAWDASSGEAHWRNRPDSQMPFFAVFNPTITHESGQWEQDDDPATPPEDVVVPPYLVDGPATRRAIARQYDHIAASDAMLGERLAELDAADLLDDTIVFVWSDHGEGLPRKKRWPLDAGTRVPLIVAVGDNVRRQLGDAFDLPDHGETTDDIASLIDLGPTVLSLCGIDPPPWMQGRPMLRRDAEARQYAFATRDRFDEFYDMMRSVRDERFRYVRNEHPDLCRWQWSPYGFTHPAIAELNQGHRDGTLTPAQSYLFATNRPVEELYDTHADPDEVRNLADDPAFDADRLRLRAALNDLLAKTGDLGREDESQMVERFWPGRIQPTTAAPMFVPISKDSEGLDPVLRAVRHRPTRRVFNGRVDLMLHCSTQGASIAWRFEDDPADAWRLYTGPIAIEPGASRMVHAKAYRIGYKPSNGETVCVDFLQETP